MAKPASDNPLIIQSKRPGFFGKLLFILELITAPFLLIIRSILVVVIIMTLGLTCFILTLGTKPTEPLGKVRKFLVYGSFRFFLRLFMYTLGIHVVVKGKQSPDAKLLIGNHTSILDAFCGPIGIQGSPITKKIDKLWPIRQVCIAARAVILNRDYNKKQQSSNNLQVREQIRDHIERFDTPILFFPGGSILDPKYNLAFKPFCFTLDQKMQLFTYEYHLAMRIPWTVQSFWALILQHFMCWGGYVKITLGPTLQRDIDAGESIEAFMERVMDAQCKMLGNYATEYTVDDIVNFFEIPQNKKTNYSEAYLRDFEWMGTYNQFCKKYGFGPLKKAWGLRAWQVANILPPDEKQD